MTRNPARDSGAALLALALTLIAPEALSAVCKTPPAGAPPCRDQIPEWTQIEYDCITGDHYANNATCDPLPNDATKPELPNNRCDQPDILAPDAQGVQQRCDQWSSDYYERPFSRGNSAIFPDEDLVYVLATQDDNWWYFLIQMYGLRDGIKLDAEYSIEMDSDLDNASDYRPAGQVSCNDWWLRSTAPTANILQKVGFDQWGQEGVIAFYDQTSNEPSLPGQDQGGCHCGLNDQVACGDIWSGNGYDQLVDDQAGGSIPNGLWAMVPSDCESIATAFIDPAQMAALGGGLFGPEDVTDATCVVLAARKTMIASKRAGNDIPTTFGWRAWASKGQQDNQNVQLHDKYNRQQSGDAYYDEQYGGSGLGPSSIKEIDSSVKLLFNPCPAFEQSETRLLTLGQDQVFAPAVAPPVRGGSPSSAFLSSFLPLPNQSRWPGSLLHFIRPIPFEENPSGSGNFFPDLTEVCQNATDVGCLAWDAGTVMLNQSPTPAQVASDRMIGTGPNQRRVTYSQNPAGAPVPASIRKFDYPATADEHDLWLGLGIPFVDADPLNPNEPSEVAARAIANGMINKTLQEITAPDPRNVGQTVTYVLGDSFHTAQQVVSAPENFAYLAANLEGNGQPCEASVNPNRGYGCFFERHRRRRAVLFSPSNDGQLHAFDAGRFDGGVVSGVIEGELDRGTGREIFAHIPRPMLKHTAEMTQVEFDFGLDATPVVDDVFIDPAHNGTPTVADREWRTVLVGGYRQGARGYYALDVTQPDHLNEEDLDPSPTGTRIAFIPERGSDYVPSCNAVGAGSLYTVQDCGPNPYPSLLWEFTDDCVDQSSGALLPCDEDSNGHDDLGLTWSKANTGRVRVQVGPDVLIRYVAIFGGGLETIGEDVDALINHDVGNFLFMVDIETGKLLYKRALVGAAPSEPAAVDTDGDAVLDTVYIGTSLGFLYKVDISDPGEIDSTSGRIEPVNGIGQPQWAPFVLFDAAGRELFFPPQVVFVAQTGQFAVGFGTGDRHNLFREETPAAGRFYMIVDTGYTSANLPGGAGVPLVEGNFAPITLASANLGTGVNYLLNPPSGQRGGWVLQLGAHERLVGDALFVAGAASFSTFTPDVPVPACNAEGTGKLYSLLATNADALGSTRSRSFEQFVTAPFAIPPGEQAEPGQTPTPTPFETTEMTAIRSSLMGLFPDKCKFGNFSHQVAAQLSDTNTLAVAQVPVCVAVKNWREF